MTGLVENLGPALRTLRKARDLTQQQVAESSGVTKAMLSAYESGKRKPSLTTLDSLLRALGANLNDLQLALEQTEALHPP